MKRKVFFVALLCSFSLSACGGGSTTTTEAPTETSIEESTAEETVTEEDAVEENSASVDDSDGWGSVRALGLDNSTMLSIYQDYQDAWESSPEDPIAKRDYKAQVDEEIAEKYGISTDDASHVYMYVLGNYDKMAAENGASDTSEIQLHYGDLLSTTVNGTTIVLKAKITSSLTKKMTIASCFYDVYDAVEKYGLDQYDELQYWAVADMTDGSEQKVISFTVPHDTLEKIANESIVEGQLQSYSTDVWLSPALQ